MNTHVWKLEVYDVTGRCVVQTVLHSLRNILVWFGDERHTVTVTRYAKDEQ